LKNNTLWLFLPLAFALVQLLAADTVTDTTLDVDYTATSTFVAGPGNVYDVFLNVDPSAFNAGSGFLTAIAMQFKTGSDVSTAVTLLAAPGGVSDWATEDVGGLNAKGCDGAGGSSGDVCFQNLSATTTVPGGPYNFEFAVTMPGTDVLTASSDIKADYNKTLANKQQDNLGLTSMGITIQTSTVPEPSPRWYCLGAGLFAAILASKRKALMSR
jgi:hypothetical protein